MSCTIIYNIDVQYAIINLKMVRLSINLDAITSSTISVYKHGWLNKKYVLYVNNKSSNLSNYDYLPLYY